MAEEPTIEHVTFTVRPGQTLGVIGSTGVGKSTLLGAINALIPATTGATMSGRIRVAGRDITGVRPRELADLVGFVGQNPLAGFVTDVTPWAPSTRLTTAEPTARACRLASSQRKPVSSRQKTTVSTALKQQFARMEQRHEKMKERWEQHRAACLIEGEGGARTAEQMFAMIDALSETADERAEEILGELYDYADRIVPELG